ncbi:MAG TPA: lysine--tRNA ligase [Patescibacteria group bacterium]|nr:lysine--tRNA ligase [Patescibacteria group bacterium]
MDEVSFKEARLEKLKKLKELGIDPYPSSAKRTHTIAQALANEGKEVTVVGRIFSYREHGNIAFANLKDESGKIQIFFQRKLLGDELFKNLRLLDIGDFIQVEGMVVKTISGEISVAPANYKLLTKSLLPLPSEHFGLKDPEIKLRKRYLDLLMNPELRDIFKKKTLFWQSMRQFMIDKGFLEVETPVLQAIPGGADARPFITHHNAQNMDLYLRISLELPLKRLLVGGFEKVFEIGRIFRNEGIDDEHLQDYTQLEFYWAYADYNELMDFTQEMYQTVIQETFGTLQTVWNGQKIDWSGNWPRLNYTQLLNEHWKVDIDKLAVEELYKLADKFKVSVEPNLGKGRLLDYLYKKTIRPTIIQPMFIINHPVEVEPLAKRLPDQPNNVQRMQVLAMGSELSKGFSELNDPIDQRKRFEEQMKLRAAGDEEAQMMDEDYVEALEYGMPPAAGFGVSERLFAMLVDKPVREVVFFPTMKPER